MKLQHKACTRQEKPGRIMAYTRPISRVLQAAFLSASLMLPGMQLAEAKKPGPKLERLEIEREYSVKCKRTALKNMHNKIHGTGCLVYPEKKLAPTLTLGGLDEFIVEFHPLVEAELFKGNNEIEQKIIYAVDGDVHSITATVQPSEFRVGLAGLKYLKGLRLASPVELPIADIKNKGNNELVVTKPAGVLTFRRKRSVEALEVLPLANISDGSDVIETTEQAEVSQPVAEPEKPKETAEVTREEVPESQPESAPAQEVSTSVEVTEEEVSPEEIKTKHPFFSLEFERLTLSKLGRHNNSGTMDNINVLVMPSINDNLSLVVGALASFHKISVAMAVDSTKIRLLSGDLVAGLRLHLGKHSAFVNAFGGVRHITPHFESKADGRSSEYSMQAFEFGARAGYDYGNMHGVVAEASNNPFAVGMLKLYLSLPYSWVTGAYPRLDIDARLLHAIKPNIGAERIGGELEQDALLLEARATVPICNIGPVVPSFLFGTRFNSEFGDKSRFEAGAENIFLGAAVDSLIADNISLGIGGIYMFTGDYMLLLKAGY